MPGRSRTGWRRVPGCELLNDVVLNQVLIRFEDDDETDRVVAAVQETGEAWMGGTVWDERRAIRLSVSNWQTSEQDVERTVAAFRAARAVAAAASRVAESRYLPPQLSDR